MLRLVDEIMSLSLIEAADLCDMCQEKLAERSGFSASAVPGRAPFPHPMAMSAGGALCPTQRTRNTHIKNRNPQGGIWQK